MAKKKLLLHVCCGPCAIMPITRLSVDYTVTAWFMNPNVQPLMEYLRRREAATQCAAHFGIEILYEDATWDITHWLRSVANQDTKPDRCTFCTTSRLAACFAKAQELGFDAVNKSLLYSIYQPHEVIATFGKNLSDQTGIAFPYQDFRVDWQAGIDQSIAMGLYRQPYCGCVYSEAERYQKKLNKLIKPHASTNSGQNKIFC